METTKFTIDRQENDSVILKVPTKSQYLHLVRLTLFGVASNLGYSFEQIEDMKVATGEAFNHFVNYSTKNKKDSELIIQFKIKENGLSIHVKDEKSKFVYDPSLYSLTSIHNTILEDITTGGLGLIMMQSLMDHVEVVQTKQGSEVMLFKMLNE